MHRLNSITSINTNDNVECSMNKKKRASNLSGNQRLHKCAIVLTQSTARTEYKSPDLLFQSIVLLFLFLQILLVMTIDSISARKCVSVWDD